MGAFQYLCSVQKSRRGRMFVILYRIAKSDEKNLTFEKTGLSLNARTTSSKQRPFKNLAEPLQLSEDFVLQNRHSQGGSRRPPYKSRTLVAGSPDSLLYCLTAAAHAFYSIYKGSGKRLFLSASPPASMSGVPP